MHKLVGVRESEVLVCHAAREFRRAYRLYAVSARGNSLVRLALSERIYQSLAIKLMEIFNLTCNFINNSPDVVHSRSSNLIRYQEASLEIHIFGSYADPFVHLISYIG